MMINFRDSFERKFEKCVLPKPKICKTDGIKSPLVFCVDKICKKISWTEKSCDEIVLSAAANGAAGVHCIENKDRKPRKLNAADVARQLQGGAKMVERHLGDEDKFHFLPVLATARGIPETVRKELGRQKIFLGEISEKIRVTRKGKNLPQFPSR